jgi:hypothetical protein
MVTYYLFYLYSIPFLLSEWKENKVPPGVPDPVRPFFAPLLTREKNLVRTAEEGHGTTLRCIFMYLSLGLYIQRFF